MVQFDANLNGGSDVVDLVRYFDHDNHYRVTLTSSSVSLHKVWRGYLTSLASAGIPGTGVRGRVTLGDCSPRVPTDPYVRD